MKKMITAALFLLFPWQRLFAEQMRITINKKTFYQSEVIKIQLSNKGGREFQLKFLGREQKSFLFGGQQTVLLGINYQLKPGTYSIFTSELSSAAVPATSNFVITVMEKYPRLPYVPPKRKPKDQKRIQKEVKAKREILNKLEWRADALPLFSWPVSPIKVNANFGEKRCKKANCRYHPGTDYRAAFDFFHQHPEPIRAINNGEVVLVEYRFLDGKTIIIDHGNGISSEYLHLSKFSVKEGEVVRRGQLIGIAGKTGATNAIHLHLTIKMDYGKSLVDPQKFLELLSH